MEVPARLASSLSEIGSSAKTNSSPSNLSCSGDRNSGSRVSTFTIYESIFTQSESQDDAPSAFGSPTAAGCFAITAAGSTLHANSRVRVFESRQFPYPRRPRTSSTASRFLETRLSSWVLLYSARVASIADFHGCLAGTRSSSIRNSRKSSRQGRY